MEREMGGEGRETNGISAGFVLPFDTAREL